MINLLRGWLHIYSYSLDMVFGANGGTDMHINSKHSGNRCRSSVIIVVLAKYYFFIQLLVQLREVFKINNWNGGVWMRGIEWNSLGMTKSIYEHEYFHWIEIIGKIFLIEGIFHREFPIINIYIDSNWSW